MVTSFLLIMDAIERKIRILLEKRGFTQSKDISREIAKQIPFPI